MRAGFAMHLTLLRVSRIGGHGRITQGAALLYGDAASVVAQSGGPEFRFRRRCGSRGDHRRWQGGAMGRRMT